MVFPGCGSHEGSFVFFVFFKSPLDRGSIRSEGSWLRCIHLDPPSESQARSVRTLSFHSPRIQDESLLPAEDAFHETFFLFASTFDAEPASIHARGAEEGGWIVAGKEKEKIGTSRDGKEGRKKDATRETMALILVRTAFLVSLSRSLRRSSSYRFPMRLPSLPSEPIAKTKYGKGSFDTTQRIRTIRQEAFHATKVSTRRSSKLFMRPSSIPCTIGRIHETIHGIASVKKQVGSWLGGRTAPRTSKAEVYDTIDEKRPSIVLCAFLCFPYDLKRELFPLSLVVGISTRFERIPSERVRENGRMVDVERRGFDVSKLEPFSFWKKDRKERGSRRKT